MPGRPEFLQAVGGQDGAAISTNATGTIETDNYRNGAFYSVPTDTAYGTAINPSFAIQEVMLTKIPSDKTLDITTVSGDAITGFDPNGSKLTLNFLEIDSLTVNDPSATGGDTFLMVIGE